MPFPRILSQNGQTTKIKVNDSIVNTSGERILRCTLGDSSSYPLYVIRWWRLTVTCNLTKGCYKTSTTTGFCDKEWHVQILHSDIYILRFGENTICLQFIELLLQLHKLFLVIRGQPTLCLGGRDLPMLTIAYISPLAPLYLGESEHIIILVVNIAESVAHHANFAPFHCSLSLILNGKKSTTHPTRGPSDDWDSVPESHWRTGAQRNAALELMLEMIANYCCVISCNSIIKQSVSLDDIWRQICEHYIFQSARSYGEYHFVVCCPMSVTKTYTNALWPLRINF